MTSPASVTLDACRKSLIGGLAAASPTSLLDEKGYVGEPAGNLVAGVGLDDFEADLRDGDGNELAGKFRAAYSSAALAVNTFAPFKRDPGALRLSTR